MPLMAARSAEPSPDGVMFDQLREFARLLRAANIASRSECTTFRFSGNPPIAFGNTGACTKSVGVDLGCGDSSSHCAPRSYCVGSACFLAVRIRDDKKLEVVALRAVAHINFIAGS
jgi:hypothetical protein